MHERLGHVGFDRMVQIIKAGKSRGLDKLGALSDAVLTTARKLVLACKACIEGKGTRTAFGHDGLDKGSAPFEVVHMDTFEARKADNPAKRYGTAAEFGEFCAFMCSAQASYFTGQNVVLDGGAYPGTY